LKNTDLSKASLAKDFEELVVLYVVLSKARNGASWRGVPAGVTLLARFRVSAQGRGETALVGRIRVPHI
jgi:hypothetical protein